MSMAETGSPPATIGDVLLRAIERHKAGDAASAIGIYDAVLELDPENGELTYLLAVAQHQLGRYDQAESSFRRAIERDSGDPRFLIGLGRNYKAQARYAEAELSYRQALELNPGSMEALVSLAVVLSRSERAQEAIRMLETALERDPNSFEVLINLGNALLRTERYDEAIEAYRRALAIRPGNAETNNNLGKVLTILGRADEARVYFEEALAVEPAFPEALLNLGELLYAEGRQSEAEALCAQAVAARPASPEGYVALGRLLFDASESERALQCFEAMARVLPNSPLAHIWRGTVLREQGHATLAIEAFERAVDLSDGADEPRLEIAQTFWRIGENRQADALATRVLESKPDFAPALNMKGNVALFSGRVAEAISFYDQAATAQRHVSVWAQNALFVRNYSDEIDARTLFAAHHEWGLKQPGVLPVTQSRGRRDRLRIGFMSPDLRQHSVAHFVTPILGYVDSLRFELICYYAHRSSDVVTNVLRKLADKWRNVFGKPARMVAELIARDEVDILIDLAGHSAENRLDVFAYAPAPMQVTYLGYPTTTGLRAMHYRLTDWVVDPENAETLSTESLLRLPDSYFCYMAPEEAPEVSNLPALSRTCVTFGSFNNMAKITPTTFRVWARVLRAVPESRLRLKNRSLEDAMVRSDVLQQMIRNGVDPDRVELRGWESGRTSHFALYNDIDIALDTLPYNGATTTCEAMWMGVPVVTLRGPTHASRMAASILSAAGTVEHIAENEEGYVNICRMLASDRAKLSAMRASLRSRLASSPLMNHTRFARNFERTLLTALEQR